MAQFSSLSKRPLSTFQINPSLLGRLSSAGITFVRDVHPLTSKELVAIANISKKEAENLIDIVSGSLQLPSLRYRSALELWKEKQEQGYIVTFCQSLDTILNGGFQLGQITEISGVPGVGKTQLCMQLAVDVHIPDCQGGQEGEAVYLDTEGTLLAERLEDLALAVADHCSLMASGDEEQLLTSEAILSGIHCYRCHNHTELIATVNHLDSFLSEHPKIKLVVIDSVAASFRNHVDDISLRTRLLGKLSQSLLQLATSHNVAVVLTNQMTTRIHSGQSNVIPALGEGWGHCCSTRLLLHWVGQQRRATVFKALQGQRSCWFSITHAGLRDAIPKCLTPREDDTVSGPEASSTTINCDILSSDQTVSRTTPSSFSKEGLQPLGKRQKFS